MIADRRSQIAIRSAIVCDHHTSAIVCDHHRRRSQKIEPCSIPAIVAIPCDQLPLCDDMKIKVLRFRNASHNISGSLPRGDSLCSNNHFVVIWRNLWRKLLMNVFTIAAEKILKTRTKGQLLGQNRAEIYRPGKRRPNFHHRSKTDVFDGFREAKKKK